MISELSFYGFVEVKNKINHKLDFGRFSSAAVYTNEFYLSASVRY